MKILSIGNSFSQDAQTYLHRIAKTNGIDLYTVNLYFGGCTLQNHFDFMLSNESKYELEVNGVNTGKFINLKDALLSQNFDVITLQQASPKSFDYATYQPYLTDITAYVRQLCPTAKIYIHQTWMYEKDSGILKSLTPFTDPVDMLNAIIDSYDKAYKDINADGLIPCGVAMNNALNLGAKRVHRDGFHASLGLGRYLLALTWLKVLTGADITADTYNDLEEDLSANERSIAKQAVTMALK